MGGAAVLPLCWRDQGTTRPYLVKDLPAIFCDRHTEGHSFTTWVCQGHLRSDLQQAGLIPTFALFSFYSFQKRWALLKVHGLCLFLCIAKQYPMVQLCHSLVAGQLLQGLQVHPFSCSPSEWSHFSILGWIFVGSEVFFFFFGFSAMMHAAVGAVAYSSWEVSIFCLHFFIQPFLLLLR